MFMNHWWNDNWQGNTEILRGKPLPVWLFFHHNAHMCWPKISPGFLMYLLIFGWNRYLLKGNCQRSVQPSFKSQFLHSEDCALWYILIIKPTRCTISQIYFGIELYTFRTGLLSIISSLALYTQRQVFVIQVVLTVC